jgi:anti-anti-sigma factor
MSQPRYRHLECASNDGALVLKLTPPELRSGDFDLIDVLRQELLAAVALNGARKIVVDLSAVQYVGSAGFRPLLSLRKKMQETGGEMMLCGLCTDVRDVFLASRLINAAGTSAAPFAGAADAAAAVTRLTGGAGRN